MVFTISLVIKEEEEKKGLKEQFQQSTDTREAATPPLLSFAMLIAPRQSVYHAKAAGLSPTYRINNRDQSGTKRSGRRASKGHRAEVLAGESQRRIKRVREILQHQDSEGHTSDKIHNL